MKQNLSLFISFFKIGLFTFGGGMAMLPWLEQELLKRELNQEEIINFFSLGQSLPGVIATNTATLVGRHFGGFWGAFWSTFGVVLPSFIVITLVAWGMAPYLELGTVQGALAAIRVCAAALILLSGLRITLQVLHKKEKNHLSVLIFSLMLIVGLFTPISPFWLIMTALILAMLAYLRKRKRAK
jgi:chromate transporter